MVVDKQSAALRLQAAAVQHAVGAVERLAGRRAAPWGTAPWAIAGGLVFAALFWLPRLAGAVSP